MNHEERDGDKKTPQILIQSNRVRSDKRQTSSLLEKKEKDCSTMREE